MKYLLVLLLLTVAWCTGDAGPVPFPMRLDLDASFDVPIGNSVLHLYVTAARWPDRARVAIHLEELNPTCRRDGPCKRRLLSGDGRAVVRAGDVVIARDFQRAAIHAVIPFTDDVARRTFGVRIDLTMRARGDFHRGDGSGNPGYFNATAMGAVATPLTTFVDAHQVSVSGMIARHELL